MTGISTGSGLKTHNVGTLMLIAGTVKPLIPPGLLMTVISSGGESPAGAVILEEVINQILLLPSIFLLIKVSNIYFCRYHTRPLITIELFWNNNCSGLL